MREPQAPNPGSVAETGRVALVTGGAGPVGAAVVRSLAARGYAVAIHDHAAFQQARDLAAELVAAGVPSLAVTADLRDDGPMRALVHRVADHFGRIDVLVTCAWLAIGGVFEEVTADDLRTHFDINCVGTFVVAQEAGAFMVRQAEGGCIVTIGDGGADHPTIGFAACSPSQGAIPALTRSLAAEFAAHNPQVRVNCVVPAPGLRRQANSEPVANAVLSLIENDALTGVCLSVG